ncbi:glycoside hydrolase family 3 protein [Serpula lacrymans var. lacrymans S7.3]|uniref:beta-glucosidase n=2 Tax=Serpula lacrymans var. lacrymans TaxID=341189 RepID=F8PMW5_SERL3|nr:family 3 glycoside hydrolase [Serpula lacrymans var. lacrymans S7.9]EGO02947.1 glycoside hydrolase family 3 protein [Serpula lacrymans var. lacrymans S7.3]EGO28924.1 family 3 glycoside hydrolase [Serpula lacrymans var. lacrymans S7.9]
MLSPSFASVLVLLHCVAGWSSVVVATSPAAAASSSSTSSSSAATSSAASTSASSTATAAPSSSPSGTPYPLSVTTYLATETGPLTLPISEYTFSPYPTPSTAPDPPVFPATDPLYPPPVSADPQIVPDFAPAWAIAYGKANALLANFTLEQKVNLTTGVDGRCVGNIAPTGDFPGLCLEDSPLGVRYTDLVTSFPAGITTASTWNRALMRTRGLYIGQEFKGKGAHIALGPMMNMGRIPQGGRNWEGFGADPFLSGEAAHETVLGMQAGGVQATAKHYINNEQEWKRTMESSNVDDRTEHEIYSQPFMRAVMGGVSSVMCSYNLINDTYACNNNKTLNDLMKREFGFQGYIMSDWTATMATLSAVAGLDMTMPGPIGFSGDASYFGGNLTAYVMNDTISMERLDDMATRIVAAWYYMHQDYDYPPVSFNMNDPYDPATNYHINVQSNHDTVVREIGAAGSVLLKNDGVLPLDKPRSLILVGSDAGPPEAGPNQYVDQGGDPTGILAMGWGSGTDNFTYLISPYEAIQERARLDQTSVFWDFDNWDLDQAGNLVIDMEVAIVFVNADSGEGYIEVDANYGDRKNLTAWHEGDELVLAVAAQNNNTIVVVNSVGPLIIEPWIEHPNVTAVVWSSLGGNEAGNAIMDILYGNWNPSGRLPYTLAKSPYDYPANLTTGGTEADILSINYTEGLLIDYRWFDAKNITPRFEFGFGLSYTTFEYSNLAITPVSPMDNAQGDLVTNWENGGASPIAEGSTTALWLHMPAFQVTFNVKNTGSVYGGEIPQLYLHHPASAMEPPSILKGFTNIELSPGETGSASITLSRYDLSIWDVVAQGWIKPNGTITYSVGASSRDFRLNGTIPL